MSYQKSLVTLPPEVVQEEEQELAVMGMLVVRAMFDLMKIKGEMPKRKPLKS